MSDADDLYDRVSARVDAHQRASEPGCMERLDARIAELEAELAAERESHAETAVILRQARERADHNEAWAKMRGAEVERRGRLIEAAGNYVSTTPLPGVPHCVWCGAWGEHKTHLDGCHGVTNPDGAARWGEPT